MGFSSPAPIGPPDDDGHFLDDIKVVVGAQEDPLTGGYDVAKRIEVGPLLLLGEGRNLGPDEIIVRDRVSTPVSCSQSEECMDVRALRAEVGI